MYLKGVKKEGETVTVNHDFTINVPYGYCFSKDDYAERSQELFFIYKPTKSIDNYNDGLVFVDESKQDFYFKMSIISPLPFENEESIDLDLYDLIENTRKNAGRRDNSEFVYTQAAKSYVKNHKVKMVADDDDIKAGYYSYLVNGTVAYGAMIATKRCFYAVPVIMFDSENYKSNEKFLADLLSSICPLEESSKNVTLIKDKFVAPAYSNKRMTSVDEVTISIPDGYKYITRENYQEKDKKDIYILSKYGFVCVPESYNGYASFKDAPMGISMLETNFGRLPFGFWLNAKNKTTLSEILKQAFGEDRNIKLVKFESEFSVAYFKAYDLEENGLYCEYYYITVFDGNDEHVFNIFLNCDIKNKSECKKTFVKAVEKFCSEIHRTDMDEELDIDYSKGDISFPKAVPNNDLYMHLSSMSGFSIIGAATGAFINQNGTECQFLTLEDTLDPDASPEMKSYFDEIVKSGSGNFKLSEEAEKMAELFRVDLNVFNEKSDREQEIKNKMLKKILYLHLLRSFVWTVSAYCEENKLTPDKIDYDTVMQLVRFIDKRRCVNYKAESYASALCSACDIHVFYVDDSVSKKAKSFLNAITNNENGNSVVSLNGLRKDLEYIYPTIQTIYANLKNERDSKSVLAGGTADVLYAWCALSVAADKPFFVEDGPMHCMWSHPDETIGSWISGINKKSKKKSEINNEVKSNAPEKKAVQLEEERKAQEKALKKKEKAERRALRLLEEEKEKFRLEVEKNESEMKKRLEDINVSIAELSSQMNQESEDTEFLNTVNSLKIEKLQMEKEFIFECLSDE